MIFKKIKWLSLIIGLSISINSFAADSEILNFPNKIDYLINLVGKKDSFKIAVKNEDLDENFDDSKLYTKLYFKNKINDNYSILTINTDDKQEKIIINNEDMNVEINFGYGYVNEIFLRFKYKEMSDLSVNEQSKLFNGFFYDYLNSSNFRCDGIIFKKYIKENIEVSGDFSYIYNTDSSVKNDDYIIHIVNVKNDALKEDNKEKFKDNLKKYFNKESKE